MVIVRTADGMRGIRRPRSLIDADRPEAYGLEHAYELQPNHLEQRQKRHDETSAVVDIGKQILEPARLGLGQACQQLIDAEFHRYLFRRQQHLRSQLRALHDRLKRGEQAEEIDLDFRLVLIAGKSGHGFVRPKPLRGAELFALVEEAGGGLELLMLEQPPDE